MQRYYIFNSVLPIEEDEFHEFKGHRSITIDDLTSIQAGFSPNVHPSRSPISRTICAFLNSGKGGTIYLGVTDDGLVKGIHLTKYQKDHISVALDDTVKRYVPSVPRHLYSMKFVPIIDKNDLHVQAERKEIIEHLEQSDFTTRLRPHILRTCKFCWCDNDAFAQLEAGMINSSYVIEIKIMEWDKNDVRNECLATKALGLRPFFENEEGNIYFRNQSSVIKSSRVEVYNITSREVKEHYQDELMNLRSKLQQLKSKNCKS